MSTSTSTSTSTATKEKFAQYSGAQLDIQEVEVLSYQKLDVYRCAVEFLALVAVIVSKIPRKYCFLADALERAGVSIAQNIAEGVGKPTHRDRSRYLGTARGSAMKCGAVLDACTVLALADAEVLEKGGDLLECIVSTLSKMMRTWTRPSVDVFRGRRR